MLDQLFNGEEMLEICKHVINDDQNWFCDKYRLE